MDEDQIIAGQKFTCLSFISPENILKKREIFYFDKFLEQYDLNKSLERFTAFLHYISFKYKLDFDGLSKDMKDFTDEEIKTLYNTTLADEYKSYIDNHEESLETEFNQKNTFQTSVRGIKIRGCFPTQEEAELRCRILRELDPNHDVFVGPVGIWLPWDPDAYKTGKVEYLEETLNQLMSEKKKNEEAAKKEFDKRIKEAKRKAIEDNIEKARESGNVLTQAINKDDNLVNVSELNTTESSLLQSNKPITTEEVRKELFEGDNIVTDKNTDHGVSEILKNMNVNHDKYFEEID